MSASDTDVLDNLPIDRYIASSNQTDFDYNFLIYDKDNLTVLKTTDPNTNSASTTKLTRGTNSDYTVSGVGNEDGGKITLNNGATDGDKYTLFRKTTIARKTDFIQAGEFNAENINLELDEAFLILQELQTELNRTPTLPEEEELDSIELPRPDSGKALAWNSSGDGFESKDFLNASSDTVTIAGNSVSLGGSTSIDHADLSNINSNDHHSKYTDSEAKSAVEAGISMTGILDVNSNDIEDAGTTIWDTSQTHVPESSLDTISNSGLVNSSLTITAGDGLKNGGSVSLGGSTTVDIEPADFAGTALEDDGSDNLQLTTSGVGLNEIDESIAPTWTSEHKFDSAFIQKEITTPSTPAAGYNKLYFKSDDNLYAIDENGNENQVGGTSDTRTDISDSGTQVLTNTTDINFGANLDVTDDGDGSVTVDGSSGDTRVDIEDDGTAIVTDASILDFIGGYFDVQNPTASEISIDITDSSIGTTAIDESIAPTWSGTHTFSSSATFSSGATFNGGTSFTADLSDDQGNTIYDYSNQTIGDGIVDISAATFTNQNLGDTDKPLFAGVTITDGNKLGIGNLDDFYFQWDDANTQFQFGETTAGLVFTIAGDDTNPDFQGNTINNLGGLTDSSSNKMLDSVAATGQVTLSSGAAVVDTGLSATDATFMVAEGVDDPDADAKITSRLFWDDSAGTYKVEFVEDVTSVGNLTVNYDIIRVR